MIATIQVTILTSDGELPETGDAFKNATEDIWIYTTTRQNVSIANCQVSVTATDLLGNIVEKTILT